MRYFRFGSFSPFEFNKNGNYFSPIVATNMVDVGMIIALQDDAIIFSKSCFDNNELINSSNIIEVGVEEWIRAKTLFMDNTLSKY